eukprot:m.136144 g.136144  ORF g.136144 m.136144 type:complete len:66 (+) comp13991_c0_seq3:4701-4898(+)
MITLPFITLPCKNASKGVVVVYLNGNLALPFGMRSQTMATSCSSVAVVAAQIAWPRQTHLRRSVF